MEVNMAKFNIIVPIFQTIEILRLFLDSLEHTLTQESNIIFINDGSGNVVQEILQKFQQKAAFFKVPARVSILENHTSLGSVAAINSALKIIDTNCEYVVFLDSDTILQGTWQDEIIPYFKEDTVAAVGGLLLYPQTGGVQCCGLTYCGTCGRHLYLNSPNDILEKIGAFEVQATIFAFCCIRQTVIKEVGLLDKHFFNGYEDLDYQFRIRELGYKIITVPSIRLFHWEKSNGNFREFNRKSNLGRFWMKHGVNVKEDLTDFIQFRLSQLNISDVSYSAIDFCEGKDDANRIKNFLNQYDGICIDSWETSAYIHSSHDTIWLPEAMDSGRIWSTTPLLFLCDQMVQLLDNHYWWSIRQQNGQKDVIIDLYGNALFFSQLQYGFWPGRKIR